MEALHSPEEVPKKEVPKDFLDKIRPNDNAIEKIVTHDGKFHTDEVFAHAILKDLFPESMELADGGKVDFVKYVRTRDKNFLNKAVNNPSVLTVDVGEKDDFEKRNMDHHQLEGAGARENGINYAAAGLTWKHFGKEWIGYVNVYTRKIDLSDAEKENIWQLIDANYIQLMDTSDTGQLEEVSYTLSNGMELNGGQFTLSEDIRLYNIDLHDGKKQQDRFNDAVERYRIVMLQIVNKYMDLMEGIREFDPALCEISKDGKTAIINQVLRPGVNSYLMDHREEFKNVEFFAGLNSGKGYSIIPVPVAEGLRKYRNPGAIPEALRLGNDKHKINELLGLKTGVNFVHTSGFTASCQDINSTKRFLDYCIENK